MESKLARYVRLGVLGVLSLWIVIMFITMAVKHSAVKSDAQAYGEEQLELLKKQIEEDRARDMEALGFTLTKQLSPAGEEYEIKEKADAYYEDNWPKTMAGIGVGNAWWMFWLSAICFAAGLIVIFILKTTHWYLLRNCCRCYWLVISYRPLDRSIRSSSQQDC